MLRATLAGCGLAVLIASAVQAQQVPGRDLLDFQVGTMAEASALAHLSGDGLWNPASVALPDDVFARFAASTLQAPAAQGVSSHLLSASVRARVGTTVGLSVVRAHVGDLLRTDTDPQTIGGEIPYNTTVASLAAAQRHEDVIVGIALRYHHGQLDQTRKGTVGLDAGVLLEDLFGGRARVAAATFLWRPGGGDDQTSYNIAADARLAGADSLHEARAGYGLQIGERDVSEHFMFLSGRYGPVEGRSGLAYYSAFGHSDLRLRLGLGLHYARYTVGIAREENGAGLAAIYQFTLSAVLK